VSYYLDVEPIEAECPSCGTDLVCPDCDEDEMPNQLGEATPTLLTQLRDLYDNAIDTGRLSDITLLDTLIGEVKQ